MQDNIVNSVQANNSTLYPPMQQDIVHPIPSKVLTAFAYGISAVASRDAVDWEVSREWETSLDGIDYRGEYTVKYHSRSTRWMMDGSPMRVIDGYTLSDVNLYASRGEEVLKTDFEEWSFDINYFQEAFRLDQEESYE